MQSHACACFTNFCENTQKEILLPYMQPLSQKFCLLIKDGCSMTKENATTALGTFVEKIGVDYAQYFQETISFLIQYLG